MTNTVICWASPRGASITTARQHGPPRADSSANAFGSSARISAVPTSGQGRSPGPRHSAACSGDATPLSATHEPLRAEAGPASRANRGKSTSSVRRSRALTPIRMPAALRVEHRAGVVQLTVRRCGRRPPRRRPRRARTGPARAPGLQHVAQASPCRASAAISNTARRPRREPRRPGTESTRKVLAHRRHVDATSAAHRPRGATTLRRTCSAPSTPMMAAAPCVRRSVRACPTGANARRRFASRAPTAGELRLTSAIRSKPVVRQHQDGDGAANSRLRERGMSPPHRRAALAPTSSALATRLCHRCQEASIVTSSGYAVRKRRAIAPAAPRRCRRRARRSARSMPAAEIVGSRPVSSMTRPAPSASASRCAPRCPRPPAPPRAPRVVFRVAARQRSSGDTLAMAVVTGDPGAPRLT